MQLHADITLKWASSPSEVPTWRKEYAIWLQIWNCFRVNDQNQITKLPRNYFVLHGNRELQRNRIRSLSRVPSALSRVHSTLIFNHFRPQIICLPGYLTPQISTAHTRLLLHRHLVLCCKQLRSSRVDMREPAKYLPCLY
jgi:hypothetical protein